MSPRCSNSQLSMFRSCGRGWDDKRAGGRTPASRVLWNLLFLALLGLLVHPSSDGLFTPKAVNAHGSDGAASSHNFNSVVTQDSINSKDEPVSEFRSSTADGLDGGVSHPSAGTSGSLNEAHGSELHSTEDTDDMNTAKGNKRCINTGLKIFRKPEPVKRPIPITPVKPPTVVTKPVTSHPKPVDKWIEVPAVTYTKFNLSLTTKVEAAINDSSTSKDKVPKDFGHKDAQLTITLLLGSRDKPLQLLLDSTTPEMWITAEAHESTKSATYVYGPNSTKIDPNILDYKTGSGSTYVDTVAVGKAKTKCAFTVLTSISKDDKTVTDIPATLKEAKIGCDSSGVLGIAPASDADGHFANEIFKTVSIPRLSIDMGGKDGIVRFGKVQESDEKKLTWNKLSSTGDRKEWALDLKGIYTKKNGERSKDNFVGETPAQAVIDTASSLIVGPADKVKKLADKLKATEIGTGSDKYAIKCDTTNLPDIILEFGTNEYVLRPNAYTLRLQSDSKHCLLGFVGIKNEELWHFGELFLQHFFTVFDYNSNSVGLSDSCNSDNEWWSVS